MFGKKEKAVKYPNIMVMFLIVSIVTGLFAACGKNSKSPPPEEIAKVVGQSIENGLMEAGADMGNGTPTLKLVGSKGNNFTYKGTVPFYSGAGSFDREITATYNGKTVVYVFDDDTSGAGKTIEWSQENY